jgi:hypothetical protein
VMRVLRAVRLWKARVSAETMHQKTPAHMHRLGHCQELNASRTTAGVIAVGLECTGATEREKLASLGRYMF